MRVSIGDCRLFVDVDGVGLVPDGRTMRQRPTLIALHGGPGLDHTSFKPEFGTLSDVAQIVYVDHRGQGRSDRSTPDRWNFAQWADDVVSLCDALGIEDPIVYGVSFGDGAYGAADSTLDFTIGRRQVVKAEASSHRIQVVTDAGVIMDFPCSYGEGDVDRNVTRSGIHVVTETYEDFYMSNPAGGYTNAHERFAVRISNNGEFIHANPASSGAQGNTNVTNGCINLSTDDAQQYFNSALYGDPVEVSGTRIELSYADGDIWDWAVSWDEWASMSALSTQQPPSQIPSTAPATPSDAPQPVSGRPGG